MNQVINNARQLGKSQLFQHMYSGKTAYGIVIDEFSKPILKTITITNGSNSYIIDYCNKQYYIDFVSVDKFAIKSKNKASWFTDMITSKLNKKYKNKLERHVIVAMACRVVDKYVENMRLFDPNYKMDY